MSSPEVNEKSLLDTQAQLNSEFQDLARRERLLPIKISEFYKRKVDEEVAALGHREGPLHRAVYPSRERLSLRAPGEVPDFVDDRENMPTDLNDICVRKYRDRMLFFPTDVCAAHCQYCFRQDVLAELHEGVTTFNLLDSKIDRLIGFLGSHPEVREVILSGGDPMTLSTARLTKVFEAIQGQARPIDIRIHTRTLLFSPKVFNDRTIQLLANANARLVMHSIHPYEICEEVQRYVQALRVAGIRLYNQFPILRKINDHPKVLKQHLLRLDELGIRNLSIFIPDPIHYSASFRISLKRLFLILDELNWTTPSWINSTRLVLDTPHGKVRREDLLSYDHKRRIAVFQREGIQVEYTDFPEGLDEPGNIDTMLWKDRACEE